MSQKKNTFPDDTNREELIKQVDVFLRTKGIPDTDKEKVYKWSEYFIRKIEEENSES